MARPGFHRHNRDLQTEDTPAPTVAEVAGWRRAVLWMLALLLRVWGRTLRFEIDDRTRALLTKSDVPAVVTIWHNRLFLSAEIFRRYRSRRPLCGLVSASKDGAWLAAFYRIIGLEPVRGSSSNYGREAARALIEKMRRGYDIGITPDGPRGPCYTVEPGMLVVSRRVNAPMILIGAEFGPAFRMKSWDRFAIPWPFTRVRMRGAVIPATREDGTKPGPEDIRAALLAINPDPGSQAAGVKR
ncbi:MAG TPA: lysophospholipid acyltransferase family protein [Candidatus Didemnitutus sp.]